MVKFGLRKIKNDEKMASVWRFVPFLRIRLLELINNKTINPVFLPKKFVEILSDKISKIIVKIGDK